MIVNYHAVDRKALAKEISNITGVKAVYKYMPTCAYEIDYFTITKEGNLEFEDSADSEEVENLLEELAKRGFIPEPNEEIVETEKDPHSENVGLTVAVPKNEVNIDKLDALLDAKGGLIQKALGLEHFEYEIGAYEVRFPWFEKINPDEAISYTKFIEALCKMTMKQKRINATEKAVINEKYAFRCFLLRLGFIGDEYKADRKVLLKNLSGSSAFKDGAKKEGNTDEISK
jgi:hypothetical protein